MARAASSTVHPVWTGPRSGRAALLGVRAAAPGAAGPLERAGPAGLESVAGGLGQPARKNGGLVGANPVDRGKPGNKLHLATDARGETPLAVLASAANVNDWVLLRP